MKTQRIRANLIKIGLNFIELVPNFLFLSSKSNFQKIKVTLIMCMAIDFSLFSLFMWL